MSSFQKIFVLESRPSQFTQRLKKILHTIKNPGPRHKQTAHNARNYHHYRFSNQGYGSSTNTLSRWFLFYKSCFYGYGRKLLSASPIFIYDWKKNNITDAQIDGCFKEFESTDALCAATVYCKNCDQRQVFDQAAKGINYCDCEEEDKEAPVGDEADGWQPFIERDNILVWRKKHPQHTHLYCYKVFGKHEDLSASAFTEVQLNVESRTAWDTTALELRVLDSHPETNSDLLYWKVKFPRFFSDRDYVYKRRYEIFEDRKQIVIYNEAAIHESAPPISGNHRVDDYWAKMVIQADTDFNQPGMSYTLTYFDNPGTTLPQAVTNFVVTKSFPEFLSRVSNTARNLELRWNQSEDVYVSLPQQLRFPKSLSEPISPQPEISREESTTESPHKIEVDLFEAAEITAPELASKSVVAKKIVELRETMKELLQKPTSPIVNFENLQDTLATLLKKGAQKKEESLDQMNKFEKRKRHNYLHEESTHVLLAKLFISIHELLEADKNMRTGKGFCSEDTKKYSVYSESHDSSESHFTSVFSEKLTDGFYVYKTPQIWFPQWYIHWFKRFSEFIQWPSGTGSTIKNQVKSQKVQVTDKTIEVETSSSDPWTVYIVRSGYKMALMILKLLQHEKV